MSEEIKTTFKMPTGEGKNLIEGHPLGVKKIIQGDLRERTWDVNGVTHTHQNTDGILLYDLSQKRERPWFVLAYESGKRYSD